MANQLLTINMITKEAIMLFVNTNSFLKNITKKFSSEFGKADAMIGDTLNIRKPLDFTVRSGATAQPQASNEQQVTLTVNTYLGVDVNFTSQDLALSLGDFSAKVLKVMVNNLAGGVAGSIMAGCETGASGGASTTNTGGIPALVNYTAAGYNMANSATLSPQIGSWLRAGAYLTTLGCPPDDRVIVMHPTTQAHTVASLTGLFNPQIKISDMYEKGIMGVDTLGFSKWLEDQTVIVHNTPNFVTLPTTTGATQSGTAINVTALGVGLNAGDVISFGVVGNGVNYVNRTTKLDSGILGTFVLTQPAAAGSTVLNVWPPVTPPFANGANQQFQTTTTSVAAGTPVTSPIAAGTSFYKNIAFHPEAVTAVFVDLPTNLPGTRASREKLDGVSMRLLEYYNGTSDVANWRLDVLFGSVWTRSEWAVAVSDTILF